MGTRSNTRNKRNTRKKGGAPLFTANKQKTVKRRHNLMAFASNSSRKSNAARQAVHQYLTHAEQEKKLELTITEDDVIHTITPFRKPASLLEYVDFAQRKCEDLIETTIHQSMRQKKRINEERRHSKQATFLANRAAARAQQAAHIASLGRLLNSPIEPGVQQELNAWNTSASQRGLDQQHNLEEAERIFQNKSSIQTEEVRLRYLFTKQVAYHIEKLDAILTLHQEIQEKVHGIMSVYYKTEQANRDSLLTRARAMIIKQIPELNGMVAIDRALPSVLEHIMELLVRASDKYLQTIQGTPLEIAKARLEHTRLQEKHIRIAKIHFELLVRGDYRLRQELAKNPYLDTPKYKAILKQLNNDIQEVKKLNSASGSR